MSHKIFSFLFLMYPGISESKVFGTCSYNTGDSINVASNGTDVANYDTGAFTEFVQSCASPGVPRTSKVSTRCSSLSIAGFA